MRVCACMLYRHYAHGITHTRNRLQCRIFFFECAACGIHFDLKFMYPTPQHPLRLLLHHSQIVLFFACWFIPATRIHSTIHSTATRFAISVEHFFFLSTDFFSPTEFNFTFVYEHMYFLPILFDCCLCAFLLLFAMTMISVFDEHSHWLDVCAFNREREREKGRKGEALADVGSEW